MAAQQTEAEWRREQSLISRSHRLMDAVSFALRRGLSEDEVREAVDAAISGQLRPLNPQMASLAALDWGGPAQSNATKSEFGVAKTKFLTYTHLIRCGAPGRKFGAPAM